MRYKVIDPTKDESLETAGMSSYSYYEGALRGSRPPTVTPQKVSYGEARFNNFDVQEVFIDGKQKGEYYIRIRNPNNKSVFNAYIFLANKFKNCDVGVIDPGNVLGLNYHIFIKTKDEMLMEVMMNMMEEIDCYINNKSVITKV